jgi:signal transduction histidine kinase
MGARSELWRLRDEALLLILALGASWETWVRPLAPPGYIGNAVVDGLGTGAVVLPVLVRRRHPLVYAACVTVGATLLWSQVRGQGQLPFVGYASALLAAYTLGAHLARTEAVTAGAVTFAAWALPDLADSRAGLPSVHLDLGFYVLVALALVAGAGVRALRAQTEALTAALHEVAATRQLREAAVAQEERLRIARDMHDVLTHTVSSVAVQAGALRVRLGDGNEAAAARGLEDTARSSMRELRQLLGLLRDDVPAGPSPSLDDVEELCQPLRSCGISVKVERDEQLPKGNTSQSLVAYRLIQESLTNVGRHGVAVRQVDVRVRGSEAGLLVEVIDDGATPSVEPVPGHGSIGMRERVAAYGGTVDIGPRADALGWQVRAVLPW